MTTAQNNNPLHAVTLQKILDDLVEKLGWEKMAIAVRINCFSSDPSIKSSLKFLRKTPWAREQVEQLYLAKIAKQPQAKTTTQRDNSPPKVDSAETTGFVWPEVNKPD
jgi:uncharacterized protein (DUF2132 family)